jgi:DNA-binding XRE family transcriptional regulator
MKRTRITLNDEDRDLVYALIDDKDRLTSAINLRMAEVRKLRAERDNLSCAELADKFDVSMTTIVAMIKARRKMRGEL